jgi:hypothetical protein
VFVVSFPFVAMDKKNSYKAISIDFVIANIKIKPSYVKT